MITAFLAPLPIRLNVRHELAVSHGHLHVGIYDTLDMYRSNPYTSKH